jgi:NAD(P)-dependent dehydrogenase (short-subunit alcohol dehydrogenase family)
MTGSYVVTGGGQGVGRAVVERLLGSGGSVVVVEVAAASVAWLDEHPAGDRVVAVIGDAGDEAVARAAADEARRRAALAGWVNNAAVFQDASLQSTPAATVLDLIRRNVAPVVVGCSTAVRAFLDAGTPGAIVNVSSHQAARPVPGCLPYATAKAAVEGLTRAVAVDHGGAGIRANAVALGTVAVERYHEDLAALPSPEAERIARETDMLHALERVGRPDEAAATIAYLLSDDASLITGATIAADGGRSVVAREP